MNDFLLYLIRKPTKIVVLLAFLYAITALKPKKNRIHLYTLVILTIALVTEVINTIFVFNNKSINLCASISFGISIMLWLLILESVVYFKTVFKALFYAFCGFALANVIFFEGAKDFNTYTFVIGAFVYIIIFLYESFFQLKRENFQYFLSNIYILIFSPVLFYFGFTFYFAFKDSIIGNKIIIWKYTLYDIIALFINLVYYTMVSIYIYREKKLKNAG